MSFLKTLFFLLIWGLSLAVPMTAEETRSEETPPEISQDLIDPQIPTEDVRSPHRSQLFRLFSAIASSLHDST
jgi:hypothetical protein